MSKDPGDLDGISPVMRMHAGAAMINHADALERYNREEQEAKRARLERFRKLNSLSQSNRLSICQIFHLGVVGKGWSKRRLSQTLPATIKRLEGDLKDNNETFTVHRRANTMRDEGRSLVVGALHPDAAFD